MERIVNLDQYDEAFINRYADYGFSNPEEMIKKGLEMLKDELEFQARLTESANLYASIYDLDDEAKEWVESSAKDWN